MKPKKQQTILTCSLCGARAKLYRYKCCKQYFYACPTHGEVPLLTVYLPAR
jgi:hypothetical protein